MGYYKNESSKRSNQRGRNEYLRAWTDMMIKIWIEKLQQTVYSSGSSSGALISSFSGSTGSAGEDITKIVHRFSVYGVYVERGTGKEFAIGNPGDIGPVTKRGKPRNLRQPQPWFSKKFYTSYMKLNEQMAKLYAGEFCQMVTSIIERNNTGVITQSA